MVACVVLYNMIIENEKDFNLEFSLFMYTERLTYTPPFKFVLICTLKKYLDTWVSREIRVN
jgi:hypothetical protein